jgi:hypothetical protein
MSNSEFKKKIINRFNLPFELLEIIKSYIFDDIFRTKIKYYKKKTLQTILNSYIFGSYSERDYHWGFSTIDISLSLNNLQIQAVNCIKCGNYLNHFHFIPNERILCFCDDYEN